MPINVVRKITLVDFMLERLGDRFKIVPNMALLVAQAEVKGDAFRVSISDMRGRGIRFQPAEGEGETFAVLMTFDKPDEAILNLSGYDEVPTYVQEVVDEFTRLYPEYVIEIRLKPDLGIRS
jgi:hypothetical protein